MDGWRDVRYCMEEGAHLQIYLKMLLLRLAWSSRLLRLVGILKLRVPVGPTHLAAHQAQLPYLKASYLLIYPTRPNSTLVNFGNFISSRLE